MNCKICGCDMVYMGALARLEHFRCPACGMDGSKPIEKREPEGEGDPCGDRDCDECEIAGCPLWE